MSPCPRGSPPCDPLLSWGAEPRASEGRPGGAVRAGAASFPSSAPPEPAREVGATVTKPKRADGKERCPRSAWVAPPRHHSLTSRVVYWACTKATLLLSSQLTITLRKKDCMPRQSPSWLCDFGQVNSLLRLFLLLKSEGNNTVSDVVYHKLKV